MTSYRWNPRHYSENARFVSELGMPVVVLLDPRPGERILDLGCGDGALTIKLVEAGCEVVGVDASPDMVQAARAIGIDARQADGASLAFNAEFEAVFSNAALHWMKDPAAVVSGVWKALKPGGRFVGEFGGHGNVASITTAMAEVLAARGLPTADPWYFPRPEEFRSLLEDQGFAVGEMDLIPRPTPLPGDLSSWLVTLAQPYLSRLTPPEREKIIGAVVEDLRPVLCDADGIWTVDYVRLRFAAAKPNKAQR
ncbi:MAG: class I SAM-dependent methyltransferase [Anaerolineales bacterium]|nr:class I SAM-dependent methyltransferase [Anaerolineales bacterium]